jgi:1-acyl-sn-glycerol-3-phosphate acyltransferase
MVPEPSMSATTSAEPAEPAQPAEPAPSRSPLQSWAQLPFLAGYLLVCLAHALCILWLFALPRYRREPFAFRLCCDPWSWYSTRLFLRPRIRVIGREHLPGAWRGFLYASNHESLVDILLLTKEVRRGFLMKRSVLYSPIGWGTYLSGSVAFNRSSRAARARALRQVITMAERSMSVVIFPEGTFGHADGRLREPHLNLLRQAWDARLPVVPLGHAGCRRAVDGQTLPVRSRAELVLVVRPAVLPADHPDADSFARTCWQAVTDAVKHARSELRPGWPYQREP